MTKEKSQTAGRDRLFADCCDEWLNANAPRVKQATYIKYEGILRNYIKAHLGTLRPSELTTQTVDGLYAKLVREYELAPASAKNILSVLGSVLKYTECACPGETRCVDVFQPKDRRGEARVLTREEMGRLIRFLSHNMDNRKFGVLLALHTGLRIGELCALRWQDVSILDRTVRVTASVQRIAAKQENGKRTKVLLTSPKSEASLRTIPVSERLECFMRRTHPVSRDCFVLTGTRKCMEPRLLQYYFKQYMETCGLRDVHFHTLRHTFATRCIEVGFEVKSLSEILGHASTQVTLDRYAHSSMELKRMNMHKLKRVGL